MSFKIKLILTFLLYGLTLVVSTLIITTYFSQKSIKSIAIENAKSQFFKNRDTFNLAISNVETKLVAIQDANCFKKFISSTSANISEVENFFLSMAESNNFVMQLRYLDKQGQEVVRIERKSAFSTPFIVQKKQLQNKQQRYYFQKTMQLNKGEIFISKLDLNIEHNKLEKPYKPVLRMATPIYSDNKKTGVLVINIFMKKLLDIISSTKLYNVYIIDNEGYLLIHPNHKYNWSRYLNHTITIKKFFPKRYKKILANEHFSTQELYSANLNFLNPDHLKMILVPTKEFIASNEQNIYKNIAFILLVLFCISIPFSLIFARPYMLLKLRLDTINKKLEEKVDKKTQELQKLNTTLEEKINERTHEQNILLSLFDLGDSVLFKWRNDEQWSVEHVSQSVEKLLGYRKREFLDGSISYASCIHPDDIQRVTKEVEDALTKQLYFFTHQPYRIITQEKSIKWMHDSTVIVRNSNNEVVNFVGYLFDISDMKAKEQELRLLSTTDTLTQIYNRLFLDEVLRKQYHRLHRNDEVCSIMIMDIDFFKKINDKYGHLVGDEVLVELSSLIKEHIRESDIFGRWGGEEFMLITPYTTKDDAAILAEKLRTLIEKHNFPTVKTITLSFGIAECKRELTLDENIINADNALYYSKENGRNMVWCS